MTCAPIIVPINDGGKIVETDTQNGTYPSGYDFALFFQGGGQWTNGPPHDPVYVDAVWAWGLNMAGIGAKKDPAKQYAAWHMESKFYQGPEQQSPYTEVMLHIVDINGGKRRPFSWVGTHDGTFGNVNIAASLITFQGQDHEPKLTFDFRGANACRVEDGFAFVFADNGVPVARQTNVAGTGAYALPYIDDADMMAVARPITTPTTNKTASGPVLSSRGTNTSGARIQAPGAAACSVELSCGVNGTKKTALIGVDSAGNLIISQTSAGGGATYYDYNASVIWRDRLNGYAKRMELSKSRLNVEAPIRPLNCTLAQATPAGAVAAGVGAEIYITDHPAGLVKVVSDGVQWRHVATAGAPL